MIRILFILILLLALIGCNQDSSPSHPLERPDANTGSSEEVLTFDDLTTAAVGKILRINTTYTGIVSTGAPNPEGFVFLENGNTVYQGVLKELHGDRLLLVSAIEPIKRVTIRREGVRSIEFLEGIGG